MNQTLAPQKQTLSQTAIQRRSTILIAHLVLVALVLGGLIAILIVNQVLTDHVYIYVPHSTPAVDTVLDLKDDLLVYTVVYSGLLLLLLPVTALAWMWWKRGTLGLLRYGVALLASAVVLAAGIVCIRGGSMRSMTPVPPHTPTPSLHDG